MIKIILAVSVFVSASLCWADDLLDIIGEESEATSVEVAITQSPLIESVRKKLGNTTAEQNIFLEFLRKQDFAKAIYQWPSAFEGTAFAKSDNGKALFHFLGYKNGIELSSLEAVLSVNGSKVDQQIQEIWRQELKEKRNIWELVQVNWNKTWTPIFGVEAEALVAARKATTPEQVNQLVELLKQVPKKSYARDALTWNLILAYALDGEAGKSAKLIKYLLKEKTSYVGEDLLHMTIGRLLFEKGFLDASVDYYKKVTKNSEYWFVAQEEMAWAYIRKGEPQNTLAVTRGLMPDSFAYFVGPETIFLRSLASLKICDYPEVKESLKTFKARFKPRAKAMLELQQNQDTAEVQAMITRLHNGRIKLKEIGRQAEKLPALVNRDERLYHYAQVHKKLITEADIAEKLYLKSMNEGTDKVGFIASVNTYQKSIQSRKQRARSLILNRVNELAKEEVAGIHKILQKMHIIEAELLQQLSKTQDLAKVEIKAKPKTGTTGSQSKYAIKFPFEGELWFDEIDNYKVDVAKACASSSSVK